MDVQYKAISFFLIVLCLQSVVLGYNNPLVSNDKCEPLTYSVCRQMKYNRTMFPNILGHRKQSEATVSVSLLSPLLKIGCSPDVLAFVCSVYFPMCTSINKRIPPCRSLCLDVKKKCLGIIQKFGYAWPSELNCNQFPIVRTEICVYQNRTNSTLTPTMPTAQATTQKLTTTRKSKQKVVQSRKLVKKYCPADRLRNDQWRSTNQKSCCKCCMRGNRAVRSGVAKCTMKKSYSKSRSFLKSVKECSLRKSKRCYLDCCNAKRKEVRNKSTSRTRRNKNRRNRNRNRRKRPVG